MEDVSKAVAYVAAKAPARLAVVDEEKTLTYGALHERAERWAAAFREAGAAPGREILVSLPNRVEFVEVLLASVRARVVPLFVNTEFSKREFSALAAATDAMALVTSRETAGLASPELEGRMRVWFIEDDPPAMESVPQATPTRRGESAGEIVFFTSGTTGKPKGAVVPMPAFDTGAPLPDLLRTPTAHLLCRPLFFRAHLTAACHLLQEGNTVVLSRRVDPDVWTRLTERHRASLVSLGPSDLHLWLNRIESGGGAFPACASRLLSTGAPLTEAMRRRLEERLPRVRVTDLYGTSELGAIAMIDREEWEGKAGSCGRPLFFTKVNIRDERGAEAPVGTTGEIWVKSRYRMKGYYKDPDATAQAFEGDFVRTGDAGRFDEDGNLYVTGRIDGAINCGGYRVFPEEVEDVLLERPDVEEAVVVGVTHPARTEQPIAFVRLREPTEEKDEAAAERLLAHCKSRLAAYKVPAAIHPIRDIPLNAAGKADRQSLAGRAADRQHYSIG
ncbi:class I adenylate-forming enzyme family protein [Paenibacillus sp.]|uniref:class I adenylate-forming enzyme family protein n=1 Tax=Paenibacillus sp. TaxID=58172 RepID=UPI0028115C83|nr:class I adenylate-forming enzyme family protein [Paenibacillus sp.]